MDAKRIDVSAKRSDIFEMSDLGESRFGHRTSALMLTWSVWLTQLTGKGLTERGW